MIHNMHYINNLMGHDNFWNHLYIVNRGTGMEQDVWSPVEP